MTVTSKFLRANMSTTPTNVAIDFQNASAFVQNYKGPHKIFADTTQSGLEFFALHKQATVGSCPEKTLSGLKGIDLEKWNKWRSFNSISKQDAMQMYIHKLDDLVEDWRRTKYTRSSSMESSSSIASSSTISDNNFGISPPKFLSQVPASIFNSKDNVKMLTSIFEEDQKTLKDLESKFSTFQATNDEKFRTYDCKINHLTLNDGQNQEDIKQLYLKVEKLQNENMELISKTKLLEHSILLKVEVAIIRKCLTVCKYMGDSFVLQFLRWVFRYGSKFILCVVLFKLYYSKKYRSQLMSSLTRIRSIRSP